MERHSVTAYANDPSWSDSLVNLAELMSPCLDAAEARAVVEVGAHAGDLSSRSSPRR